MKDFLWCQQPLRCGTEILDHLLELNATRATEMEPPLTFDQAMVEAGMVLSRNGEQERPPAEGSMTSRNVENKLKFLSKEVS